MRARQRAVELVAAWARKRQGTDTLPLELRSRRLYILPTRAGLGFALLLFVMLIASLNYTNSLGLLLTFTLAGFALIGMLECQRTLQGLQVQAARALEVYAGDQGRVEVRFANPARIVRRALALNVPGSAATRFELAAGATATVHAGFPAPRRGRQVIDRLQLATTAPFGLFRAWTWLYLPLTAIVYPRPAGSLPLPRSGAARPAATVAAAGVADEQWASLRAYQSGDSPRSIAWKAYARGAPLMVAQYEGAGGGEHHLDYGALAALDAESRLSQLTRWVDACHRDGSACALRLPGQSLPLGLGAEHRRRLLHALALQGLPP